MWVYDLFQFHIVRLKGVQRNVDEIREKAFQFHIVRLKASDVLRTAKINAVSIPYSSIKSSGRRPTGLLPHVSIPYSSIKSKNVWNKASRNGLFQFHIVRLKANLANNLAINSLVSIPYSSIKSLYPMPE